LRRLLRIAAKSHAQYPVLQIGIAPTRAACCAMRAAFTAVEGPRPGVAFRDEHARVEHRRWRCRACVARRGCNEADALPPENLSRCRGPRVTGRRL
jgi:hypothetical protein